MVGNYLSVIVLFNAWQDAGRGAATAPLIRPTRLGLQGEERREKEGERGGEKIGKTAAERDRKDGK